MSKLTPNLFQRRFQDLVEMVAARLPSLAPDWTDYNAHDPHHSDGTASVDC